MKEFHPASEIFDLLEGNEFDELVASIRKIGLIEEIWLHPDGRVLDGRNRYRACIAAGVEPRFKEWDGIGFAADFVYALNFSRRHLDDGAKQIAAGRYAIELEREARQRQGARTDLGANLRQGDYEDFGRSRSQAADKFGVGTRTVDHAVKVLKDGARELVQAVERDKVSVSAAATIAEAPIERQREIVARGEKEILEAAKQIRAEKASVKREERIQRIADISRGNAPLLLPQRYPIIYADPPWRYENPPMGSAGRAIENHYPTMTLEEICALTVSEICTEDALLYLWATAPKLAECMKVIEAWGFEYRTNMVWDKEKIGMGYHVRNQHELLLIAKRGNIPPPVPGTQPSSLYRETRGEHSAKPDFFYEMIETAYPSLPKIELFSRRVRVGWTNWGNQASAA